MRKKVLVIAPHPDDESIGCGGAVCLHCENGDDVHIVVLTSGERGLMDLHHDVARSTRETEARRAASVLGVSQITFLRLPDFGLLQSIAEAGGRLSVILNAYAPEIIYLPHPDELHIDHSAALPIVRSALRCASLPKRPKLQGYEVWSPMTWYDTVQDITRVMHQKLRAVRCHRSQLRTFRHDHAIRGLARYRGVMTAGGVYAEVFRELDHNIYAEFIRNVLRYGRAPARFRTARKAVSWLRSVKQTTLGRATQNRDKGALRKSAADGLLSPERCDETNT